MDARRRRSIKKASLRQERRTAKDIGGRTQANSGATRMGGGADVRGTGMRVECKFTEKDRYTLKLSELEKLRKQATQTLELPVFQFAFKFRSTMEKYAVTRWDQSSLRKSSDTTWLGLNSITIKHEELKQELLKPDHVLVVNLDGKMFRIQRWDDFIEPLSGPKDISIGYKEG